ncbi:hypothetical protein CL614_05740 [archaeon]|nr:hypothetical protein [archaeon]
MNIGIVGSRRWTDKIKIKDFIFELKNKYGDNIAIVSGGCRNGADKYAKKYALEFDMKYEEFPPTHEQHNMFCVLPKFKYEKPYAVWHFFERNKQIAEHSDIVVGFIPDGIESNGTMSTINHANKLNKKTIIIS